jgi:hypothetical protein
MIFCTSCGRERSGTTRFCTSCGAEFTDPPQYEPTVMAEQPRPEDNDPPGTVISTPSPGAWAPTGPYGAAPGQQPPGSPRPEDADQFGGTFLGLDAFHETMTATSGPGGPAHPGPVYADPPAAGPDYSDPVYAERTAQQPAYPPPGYAEPGYAEPGYPGPGYPQPEYAQPDYTQPDYAQPGYGGPVPPGYGGGPASGPRRSGPRNKVIFVAVAVVIFLAAAGGAYALVAKHSHGSAAAPPTQSASIPATQSAPASPTAPTTAPPTSASASASSGVTVAVAPAAASNAAAPQVTSFLNSYFTAINAHDYQAYDSLLDQQMQPYPQSSFDAGFGTTTDSAETLTSITDTGSGGEAASVTFTSHQQPTDSPDNSSCDHWSITLFLVPNGSGYLDGPPPSGYHAAYQAC